MAYLMSFILVPKGLPEHLLHGECSARHQHCKNICANESKSPHSLRAVGKSPQLGVRRHDSGGRSLSCQLGHLDQLFRLPDSLCPLPKGEDDPYPVFLRILTRIK